MIMLYSGKTLEQRLAMRLHQAVLFGPPPMTLLNSNKLKRAASDVTNLHGVIDPTTITSPVVNVSYGISTSLDDAVYTYNSFEDAHDSDLVDDNSPFNCRALEAVLIVSIAQVCNSFTNYAQSLNQPL